MRETFQKLIWEPGEKQAPVLPSGAASILLLAGMAVSGFYRSDTSIRVHTALGVYCLLNALYIGWFHFAALPSPRLKAAHIRVFILVEVLWMLVGALLLPHRLETFLSGLMILLSISLSIVSRRRVALTLVAGAAFGLLIIIPFKYGGFDGLIPLGASSLVAGVAIEAIHKLKSITHDNINRVEIINEFSRQINSSLETRQVLALLSAIFQKTLEADTYFIGLMEDSQLDLKLFCDEGEYYSGMHLDPEGTLSGWVINNQKELFLPDLRGDLSLVGVRVIVIGKEKTNLSWMGVPLTGQFVKGVMAIASYRPNAFDRSDLELMNNMARHAVLALDNTYRHAEVEAQSHLDSLTEVYNHGYFLKLLRDQTQARNPLALIMLDIDHFKQYNDTYGHIRGDEILTAMCATIQRHIKQTDFVGRWGGEEFAIALPGANGRQAHEVALRIQESLSELVIQVEGEHQLPAPTISQGIAQFPGEADEMMELVDLADQRVYVAKQRGRNQVEPPVSHWDEAEEKGK